MKTTTKYSPEVRERAVRLVLVQQEWVATCSIAAKIGCTAETLRRWVRSAERDTDKREGQTNSEGERIKALEHEVRELRQANEILRKAPASFAQAKLDRRFKPSRRSSASIVQFRESNRSAGYCRSLHRPTTHMRTVRPIPSGCRYGRGVTRC